MKRLLIIGGTGTLGTELTRYFIKQKYKITTLVRNDFDILNHPIEKLVCHLDTDLVINCTAVTKKNIPNHTSQQIHQINGCFPVSLARLCASYDLPCIHISTDGVFLGDRGKYTEADPCDSNDLYGISKGNGDQAKCMIIRTSFIAHPSLDGLIGQLKLCKNILGFRNHFWNGLTTLELSQSIESIIRNNLYDPKIYHLFSPSVISKLELLLMAKKIFQLKTKIEEVDSELPLNRSLDSIYLLTSKLGIKPFEEQLKELKTAFNGCLI